MRRDDEDDYEPEEDAMEAARERRRLIDSLDAELAELADPVAREERRLEDEARERWRNLPSARLRPGVPACRLTEREAERLDQEGY
jgi:hypothetical protein